VIVALTAYCWLLCLYPVSYREEFGEEMKSVFRDARNEVPPTLIAKISFYAREFSGLLSGALRAHFDRLFGPALSFRRFYMQPQFRFPRSTVFLMLVIFAGTILTIAEASKIAGDTRGWSGVWPSLGSVLVFMLVTMCAAAAIVWGILHTLRRSGVHRLENVQSWIDSVKSNGI
jgi:hypothetical protein